MKKLVLAALFIIGCATPVEAPVQTLTPVRPLYAGNNWICSSVVVDEHYILTAAHCVESDQLWLDGFPAIAVSVHPDLDIAIVYFEQSLSPPYAKFGPAQEPGEPAMIEGYGCREPGQTGPIHATRRLEYLGKSEFLGRVYSGIACRGDSGGGVFNSRGELVGVAYAIPTREELKFVFVVGITDAFTAEPSP